MLVGVLGGGQLGRMLALAGYPLGLRFRFFDPAEEAPAGQLAEHVRASYDDEHALARFADGLDAVTYEFENVPVAAARFLEARVPRFFPAPVALETAQDRLAEKRFFESLGAAVPIYAPVETLDGLVGALPRVGVPAVLKTRRMGYDGRGQFVLRDASDADAAWQAVGGAPSLLEAFVPFDRELSIIAARAQDGSVACYPLAENKHAGGILRRSLAPAADVAPHLRDEAEALARAALEALGYVGVLAIELFEADGRLLVNEMAPRVHNSGHWTIEGAATSQFEQHLRAGLGLPLGATDVRGSVGMLNLIGSLPEAASVLAVPGARLHIYGKTARPGRKLGHVTVLADDERTLHDRLARLEALL